MNTKEQKDQSYLLTQSSIHKKQIIDTLRYLRVFPEIEEQICASTSLMAAFGADAIFVSRRDEYAIQDTWIESMVEIAELKGLQIFLPPSATAFTHLMMDQRTRSALLISHIDGEEHISAVIPIRYETNNTLEPSFVLIDTNLQNIPVELNDTDLPILYATTSYASDLFSDIESNSMLRNIFIFTTASLNDDDFPIGFELSIDP